MYTSGTLDVHILPENDDKEHHLWLHCPCNPNLKSVDGKYLVRHIPYDERPFIPWEDLEIRMGSGQKAWADEQQYEWEQSDRYKTYKANEKTVEELWKLLDDTPLRLLTVGELRFLQERVVYHGYGGGEETRVQFYSNERVERLKAIYERVTTPEPTCFCQRHPSWLLRLIDFLN